MSEIENPIKKYLETKGLTRAQMARIVGLKQPTVSRHALGRQCIQDDSMEKYNRKAKIPFKDMRDWNRHLRAHKERYCECEAT